MTASSDLATFGRGYAIFSAIVGSIIGLVFVVLGFVIMANVDKFNRQNPKLPKQSKTPGYLLLALGIIVIVVSWVLVWFTRKNKNVAEAEGVLGGVSIAEDLFQSF